MSHKIIVSGTTSQDVKEDFIKETCVDIISKLQYVLEVSAQELEIVLVYENRGVMWHVERWCRKNKVSVSKFPINWNDLDAVPCMEAENTYGKYNKLAGVARLNSVLIHVKEGLCGCIGFTDGKYKTAKDVVKESKKLGVPVWDVKLDKSKIKLWNGGGLPE
jgi:hypothetical protein